MTMHTSRECLASTWRPVKKKDLTFTLSTNKVSTEKLGLAVIFCISLDDCLYCVLVLFGTHDELIYRIGGEFWFIQTVNIQDI